MIKKVVAVAAAAGGIMLAGAGVAAADSGALGESGLVAGPDSLLAPDWVPWEERMQAMNDEEENAQEDAEGFGSADEQTGAETESTEPAGTQSTDTGRRDSRRDGEPSEGGASS
ncbi:DUF3027 domain-containing protein [Streptomyces xinghaiensis]